MSKLPEICNQVKQWRKTETREIPGNYFRGYRNLALTRDDIKKQGCTTCKHALGALRWHCDMPSCKWESCYVADEITAADLNAGKSSFLDLWLGDKWILIPSEEWQ